MAVNLAKRAGNLTSESIVLASKHLVTVIDFLQPTNASTEYTFPKNASDHDKAAFAIPQAVFDTHDANAVVTLLYHSLGPLLQDNKRSDNETGNRKSTTKKDESGSSSVVGSKVISVTLVPPLQTSVENAIQFGFHLDPMTWSSRLSKNTVKTCSFLNFSMLNDTGGAWSNNGCHMTSDNDSHVECSCDHMTSFAVLVQVVDIEISEADRRALDVISLIGCVCSIIGTFLTCSTYLFLRMTSERTLIHFNLAIAIMLAQVTFLFEDSAEKGTVTCAVVAMLLYFFNTAIFCWMLIEGVQIYFQVVVVFVNAERLKMYILTGWGFPLILTVITTAILRESLGTHGICWLSVADHSIWFFAVPVIIVILINCYILVRVTKLIVTLTKAQGGSKIDNAKKSTKASVMLLPLLGCTWVFGFLCVTESTIIFHYLFAIFNSFQGFCLFLAYCAFSTEVRDSWSKKRESWSLSRSLNARSSKVSPASKTTEQAWEHKARKTLKTYIGKKQIKKDISLGGHFKEDSSHLAVVDEI
ncbi:adhesion G-protein coupled receptor D1-like [Patiria miniata]|uniref:Uncharacterized protein n=1 Tax=Patiria miniata TaxID=46514 RepID=A0A913ZE20_PATMI|nr:adhesion G-protein coupled receptor D1-like [Patiria miniata]